MARLLVRDVPERPGNGLQNRARGFESRHHVDGTSKYWGGLMGQPKCPFDCLLRSYEARATACPRPAPGASSPSHSRNSIERIRYVNHSPFGPPVLSPRTRPSFWSTTSRTHSDLALITGDFILKAGPPQLPLYAQILRVDGAGKPASTHPRKRSNARRHVPAGFAFPTPSPWPPHPWD
jgi:hypothetical protein